MESTVERTKNPEIPLCGIFLNTLSKTQQISQHSQLIEIINNMLLLYNILKNIK